MNARKLVRMATGVAALAAGWVALGAPIIFW
jgi:hypothetical protein